MRMRIQNILRNCVLVSAAAASVFGQISQNHPELCGKPNQTIPLPQGVTVDSSGPQPMLHIALAGRQAEVPFDADVVEQVCPLGDSRLVVFGLLSDLVSEVKILEALTGSVLDSFWAYSPLISPNQRWLVFRDFYALSSDLPITEQYLLYDLSKDASGNRITAADHAEVPGKVIYPAVRKHIRFNNIAVPREQVHEFRSDGFYWVLDNNSVIFADALQGQVSIVLVRLKANGEPTALIRNVSVADVCADNTGSKEALLTLENAQTNATDDKSAEVIARFKMLAGGCRQHDLVLHLNDFSPARIENYLEEPNRRPSRRAK